MVNGDVVVPVAVDAQVVDERNPIEALAALIDDACGDLNLVVWNRRQERSSLALAAHLILNGAFPWASTPKWCSLVEPGDVIDGQVVIRARSSVTYREGGSVEITIAKPVIGRDLDDVEWVDEHVRRYRNAQEMVVVYERIWPVRR